MGAIIDEHMVRKISEIARVHLTEEEAMKMSDELERILEHFKVVGEIKGRGEEAGESTYHYDMKNTMRDDAASKSGKETVDGIRKEFTKSEDSYLAAPKSMK